uniref:Protein-lysine N-methyltransferase n=1 Tax=Strigamia maritima TaxID=126957 RepID=T1JCD2_STRMM
MSESKTNVTSESSVECYGEGREATESTVTIHPTESDSDSDTPALSESTAQALQEFYDEKFAKEKTTTEDNENIILEEDWQLSQFWYTDETALTLATEAQRAAGENGSIACVSCPTVYKKLRFTKPETSVVKLFEFDQRFSIFQDAFVFYDFNKPLELDETFKEQFDVVLADPPFLSEECMKKIASTINFLSRGKVILCTGAIMEGLVEEILSLHRCQFEPDHVHLLGNPFYCYANYNFDDYVPRKVVSKIVEQ